MVFDNGQCIGFRLTISEYPVDRHKIWIRVSNADEAYQAG